MCGIIEGILLISSIILLFITYLHISKTCPFACWKVMFCGVKGMLLYVSVLFYTDFNIMAFITSAAHSCCNVYVSMLMIRANIFLKETHHSSHCSLTYCRSARYSVMSCRPNSSHNMETAIVWRVGKSTRHIVMHWMPNHYMPMWRVMSFFKNFFMVCKAICPIDEDLLASESYAKL